MAELTPSPRSEGLAGRTSLKVTGTAAASSASSAAFMISRWQGCPHRANGGGARPSGQSRGCSGACGCARDSCRRNADKTPHHGPARLSTAHYQDGAEPVSVQSISSRRFASLSSATSRLSRAFCAASSRSTATTVSRPVSYTHLRAHETDSYLVCRLLLE